MRHGGKNQVHCFINQSFGSITGTPSAVYFEKLPWHSEDTVRPADLPLLDEI
jgi:hypothetical protein